MKMEPRDVLEWLEEDATEIQRKDIAIGILRRKNKQLEAETHRLKKETIELYRQIKKERYK